MRHRFGVRYRRSPSRYVGVLAVSRRADLFDVLVDARYVSAERTWRPPTDVAETSEALLVTVELPGVNDDDVDIVLGDDALVISGSRQPDDPGADAVYHWAQIRQGTFRVAVPVRGMAIDDEIEASFDRGLLRIRLPKRRRQRIVPGERAEE